MRPALRFIPNSRLTSVDSEDLLSAGAGDRTLSYLARGGGAVPRNGIVPTGRQRDTAPKVCSPAAIG